MAHVVEAAPRIEARIDDGIRRAGAAGGVGGSVARVPRHTLLFGSGPPEVEPAACLTGGKHAKPRGDARARRASELFLRIGERFEQFLPVGCEAVRRERRVRGQGSARAGRRCRAPGRDRPRRPPPRLRRHRRAPVLGVPEARPRAAGLVRPRPVRAVGRPRLDAAVRAAAPVGLRPVARRHPALPAAPLEDARTPRARADPRGRDHDRSARPGPGQRGRVRAGRTDPGRALRQRARRPPHLRARERRRHDGGRRERGVLARRPPGPGPARGPVRRQPRDHRRADLAQLLGGRRAPLRSVRVGSAARRRPGARDGARRARAAR